ncbi:MAG: hypothetical protein A2Z96_06105 [Spirochaetes bacterium GWB1_48_6]|nr:MAG: hypothetical protein A2Z96_06105 [Spirochaetes bacterium GWB1_48_6]
MRAVLLFLGLFLGVSSLYSLEFWPLKFPEIRRVFLQTSTTGLFPGTEIVGPSPEVLAPEKGEVVFVSQQKNTQLQNLPSALEGFVILAHEENLRSTVAQITPSVFLTSKTQLLAGERMGTVLDPAQPRVRMFVFDQQLSTVVNPQMVLPSMEDKRSPLIFDALLVSEEGKDSLSILKNNRIAHGYWSLVLDAGDPQNSNGRDYLKGIYSVNGFHNGTEFFRCTAESLKTTEGRYFFFETGDQSPKVARDIRAGERTWNLGKLFITEGTNIIEIVITDYAGNESSRIFNLRGGSF